MDKSKRLILKIGAIFIGILLFLTFFSRTIYSFNLPSVVVEYPQQGAIIRTASGQGIVDFMVGDSYYAKIGGKIELLVEEGELIEAGRELYTITAQNTLDEDIIRLKLDKARADRVSAQRSVSDAAVVAAQKDLADTSVLYEAGAATQRELENKQAALDELILQYQQELQDRDKTLRDLQYQIEEYELQLQAAMQGTITVLAERGGVVREISAEAGANIGENGPVMKIGVAEEGYKAVFSLPENVDYLQLGDAVTFNIKSRNIYGASGEITRLIMENGRLKAQVRFMAAGVSGGETAEIKIHNTSDLYQSILPISALRSDEYYDFVLYAEKVKGFFGYEYYARRKNVGVEIRNNYSAAIEIYKDDGHLPVIINSDKPIAEGDRVRIVGGSDLVEIR